MTAGLNFRWPSDGLICSDLDRPWAGEVRHFCPPSSNSLTHKLVVLWVVLAGCRPALAGVWLMNGEVAYAYLADLPDPMLDPPHAHVASFGLSAGYLFDVGVGVQLETALEYFPRRLHTAGPEIAVSRLVWPVHAAACLVFALPADLELRAGVHLGLTFDQHRRRLLGISTTDTALYPSGRASLGVYYSFSDHLALGPLIHYLFAISKDPDTEGSRPHGENSRLR